MALSNHTKSSNDTEETQSAILYIMVIGFHHKKGCQLEFVYPIDSRISKQNVSQIEGSNVDLYKLPSKWRNLPSLALPDGSHHYENDFVYFHLEDDNEYTTGDKSQSNEDSTQSIKNQEEINKIKCKPQQTIFGISCYKQIDVSQLIIKDSDVTRNTIQKSVCVLSSRPFYSGIRIKLQSITNAYFEQKDFHKTDLLVDAYFSLSKTFSYSVQKVNIDNKLTTTTSPNNPDLKSQYLTGFSLTDLVLRYQHKILVLFKLFLLQKKCLFQLKPVSNLSNTIMTIASLVPEQFETNGLMYCSGFFDSIDLINCELDRKEKNNNRNRQLQATNSFLSNQSISNNNTNQKFSKKKKMSFSKKKPSTNGANSDSSLVSSLSSVSIKTLSESFNNSFKNSNNNDSNSNSNSQNNSQLEKDLDIIDDDTNAINCKKAESEKETVQENLSDLLKSKVNSVFKLVDWTGTSSSPTSNTSSPTNLTSNSSQQSKIDKEKKKLNISKSNNKLSDLDSLNNTIEFESNESTSYKSSLSKNNENNSLDLLEYDFGMPINLFNQFNILHPYLSLYYLEYFTMINKMNTKLFCTTTLMMSMFKDKQQQQPEKLNDDKSNADSNDRSVLEDKQTNETANSTPQNSYIPGQQSTNVFGYTIGATNILFKQRLYDELDAIIDETDIDFRNNETLKKQLQLSTADLRFIDYIIKSINSSSKSNQTVTNTPTLLSFKKISSFSNIMNDINDESTLSSSNVNSNLNWEGSEDWIRLNFKMYFYSLLASIVKEDICELISNEMNTILLSLNNEKLASSSSSSSSLPNEVVDIDDYIEKVSIKQKNDQQAFEQDNQNSTSNENESISSSFKIKKKSRKSSIVSVSSNILSNSTHSDFRDDFNSNYIHELKNTEWYKEWSELNHEKLAKSIFKIDLQQYNSQTIQTTSATATEMNSRLQFLANQMQELEKLKIIHPFNGQISVNDIKLKLNVLFNTTDSGRKINKALIEGSKIVNSTGKAVGDALTQAKSTFSSFLSNWSSPSSSPFSKTNSSKD